jgi:hypothetical protein
MCLRLRLRPPRIDGPPTEPRVARPPRRRTKYDVAVNAEPSLSSLIQGWAKGVFHRAYLLGGPDTLTKEEALSRLKKEFIGDDPSGMGVGRF